jgi:hypothetical protein
MMTLAGCFGTGQTGAHESAPAKIAKDTISAQTEIARRKILIEDIQAIDYRDSSLGCPRAGMSYLQVITPGYRVKASAEGRRFDVRIAGNQALICSRERNLQQPVTTINQRPVTTLNPEPVTTLNPETPVKCTSGPWQDSNCEN